MSIATEYRCECKIESGISIHGHGLDRGSRYSVIDSRGGTVASAHVLYLRSRDRSEEKVPCLLRIKAFQASDAGVARFMLQEILKAERSTRHQLVIRERVIDPHGALLGEFGFEKKNEDFVVRSD